MIYIGIDVAKDSLVGVRIDRSSCVKETFIFENKVPTITKFVDQIQKKWKRLTVGCEATGYYHNTLALSCLEKGIPFRLLNPIITKQYTRVTVRKRKTDLTDAHIIAKLISQKEGTLLTKAMFTMSKPAIRTAMKLNQMEQMLVLIQQKLQLVGIDHFLIEEVKLCQEQLGKAQKVFRGYAEKTVDDNLRLLLMSIPGVGTTIATTLIAELGDITRFPNGESLVAFCGLHPKVKQSGGSLHHNTHITKRASPNLRRAIFIAASIAQRCDSELKEYFDKKRGEGKFYKEATVANARKLLYRIYPVGKRGTPFVVS